MNAQTPDLVGQFREVFGRPPLIMARAPGRVNLIGEHTDYNDGFVLPVAIDRAVYVAAAPRQDRRVRLWSLHFQSGSTFHLDDIPRDDAQPWSNYGRGVTWAMRAAGLRLVGMDALVWGDVPIGAGLSSSAALEVACACAFQSLSRVSLERIDLAKLCHRAETEFVGIKCGLMDQLIAVWGERGHAILIDCRSLEYRKVPLPSDVAIVVADTMKRRELVDSAYNERRAQCEEGARRLGVPALRDVSVAEFERRQDELPEPIRHRVRHIVHENQRVLDAVAALRAGDFVAVGRLLDESHRSLRDDYQVSCRELDVMVEVARRQSGVYGARLTGAGFGGCTVNLVRADAAPEVALWIAREYERATGLAPQIRVCQASEGASVESPARADR